jgi:tRNA(Ile)-lysidine synthase
LVVAFSGGPDSMYLLDVLHGLVKSGRLDLELAACHVDHMLRPCSGSDAEFCRKYTDSLGIRYELCREDVASVSANMGICLEDAARRVRYRLLEQAANSMGACAVATGHNLDDQAETVLMRILRGTGLAGLTGIRRMRPVSEGSEVALVRPLLDITREQILSYLEQSGLQYVTDETNQDRSYLRNRIRAELLPFLEQRYNPSARRGLARLAQAAASAENILRDDISRAWSAVVLNSSPESVVLRTDKLRTAGRGLLYGIMSKALDALGHSGALTYARFEPLAAAIFGNRTSGRLQPGAGVSVEFEGDRLLVTNIPFPQSPAEWEVGLQIPGITEVNELGGSMVAKIAERSEFDLAVFKKSKSSFEEALDAGLVAAKAAVRPVKTGDFFQPLGMSGTKKVSDFLIDRKVPLRSRASEAVVTVDDKVAWLLGRRLDGRFAVGANTSSILLLGWIPWDENSPEEGLI